MKPIEMLGQVAASMKCKASYDEPMKVHTTFKIGGPADLFVTVDTQNALAALLKKAKELEVPFRVIGKRLQFAGTRFGNPGNGDSAGWGILSIGTSGRESDSLRRIGSLLQPLQFCTETIPCRSGICLGNSWFCWRSSIYECRRLWIGNEKCVGVVHAYGSQRGSGYVAGRESGVVLSA